MMDWETQYSSILPYVCLLLSTSMSIYFTVKQISFIESNWIYEGSTDCPSLLDFLSFLTNITEISFTADYTVVST